MTISIVTGFSDYRNRVFRYYEEERYSNALEVAIEASRKFPEYDAKTSFWIACFQTRLGHGDEAVETLLGSLRRGNWWPVEVLQDPDLEPIRNRPEFESIEAECLRLKRDQPKRRQPELMVRAPAHYPGGHAPALMVFHQHYGERPELSAEPWTPMVPKGTLLAAPWSSQVFCSDGRCWDNPDWAEEDVKWAYKELIAKHRFDSDRLVLGGFSQGGALSIYYVLKRIVPSRGFVAVAPSDWVVPERPALERDRPSEAFTRLVEASDCRGLRGVIIIGDKDAFFPKIKRLYLLMIARGLNGRLQIEPGLGHAYPTLFESKLQAAVDFVLVG